MYMYSIYCTRPFYSLKILFFHGPNETLWLNLRGLGLVGGIPCIKYYFVLLYFIVLSCSLALKNSSMRHIWVVRYSSVFSHFFLTVSVSSLSLTISPFLQVQFIIEELNKIIHSDDPSPALPNKWWVGNCENNVSTIAHLHFAIQN